MVKLARYLKFKGNNSELQKRQQQARALLSQCHLCPRKCGVNRLQDEHGFCGLGRDCIVASYGPHHGEEPCISGRNGSGTIFFSGCNLKCVFCQNWDISNDCQGSIADSKSIAKIMILLQKMGCHNINLVTPTHVVPHIIEALSLAIDSGLNIPIVYNSSGYENVETLKLLDGLVDIYMPDFKFWNTTTSHLYTNAPDYPQVARVAIKEMHKQVGDLVVDKQNIAIQGLLIRHLVMPNCLADTEQITEWIASQISPSTAVNIMAQYRPYGKVSSVKSHNQFENIARRITPDEFDMALYLAKKAGLTRIIC